MAVGTGVDYFVAAVVSNVHLFVFKRPQRRFQGGIGTFLYAESRNVVEQIRRIAGLTVFLVIIHYHNGMNGILEFFFCRNGNNF